MTQIIISALEDIRRRGYNAQAISHNNGLDFYDIEAENPKTGRKARTRIINGWYHIQTYDGSLVHEKVNELIEQLVGHDKQQPEPINNAPGVQRVGPSPLLAARIKAGLI